MKRSIQIIQNIKKLKKQTIEFLTKYFFRTERDDQMVVFFSWYKLHFKFALTWQRQLLILKKLICHKNIKGSVLIFGTRISLIRSVFKLQFQLSEKF